jgi:RND superfamily putative drug exporter
MLYRLGHGAARHKWWVIAAWFLVIAGLIAGMAISPGNTKDVFTIPGAESQKAIDLLSDKFPAFSGPTATVVFHDTDGKVTDAAAATAITDSVTAIGKLDHVAGATDPTQAPFSTSNVSSDGTIAYSTVAYDVQMSDLDKEDLDDLEAATDPATKAGLQVEFGGGIVDLFDPPNPGVSEYADEIGLLLALVILVISFGAVVAAGMPIGVALAALCTSAGVLSIFEHFFTIGSLNPVFGTMLGLGVGIDYSLLVVNRYLQDRQQGMSVPEAAGQAIATAGRAVLFAGLMICMATIALAVIGVPYVTMLGFTSAMYVAFTVIAALTLLPALLGLAGRHIESLRVPWKRHQDAAAVATGPTFWGRWATHVRRHPWVFGGVALIGLLLLAVPIKDAMMGFDNDGNLPKSTTQRQAYDLLSEGFGEGVNGPLLVAIDLPGSSSSDIDSDLTAAGSLNTAFEADKDVQSSAGPLPNDDKTAAIINVTPKSGPSSETTTELVKHLRNTVIPDTLSGTTLDASHVYVGGQTAEFIDFDAQIESRLSMFIGVVLLGAFLLLVIVLRSLLVPLKAVILNLLMFCVSMGLITAIFQWGWGRTLLGVDDSAPIESFIPLILFAVLFGLSTDYEVFLVTRIREEYDHNGDARKAVNDGIDSTGRVVASAALIMASVFLSFATNPQIPVKMIGVGLGLGILLDGLVVRLVLVPAILQLMGPAAWWFPRWLDRIVPHIAIEGPATTPETATDPGSEPVAADS